MRQWGFYFNQDRCIGCKACSIACKNWNEGKRGDNNINVMVPDNFTVGVGKSDKSQSYVNPVTGKSNSDEFRKYYMKEDWRRVEKADEGKTTLNADGTFSTTFNRRYLSMGCNHCTDPGCAKVCPVSVYVKDPDTGIVRYSNGNCISCGRCIDKSLGGCPFGAPQFFTGEPIGGDGSKEPDRPRATKCDLCFDRIKEGLKPACVAACWNRALDAGPMEELMMKYPDAKNNITMPAIELRTQPNILFKDKQPQIK